MIIIDEIGTAEECIAARTIAQRGVQLVATAHGNELENVIKNPSLADLVSALHCHCQGMRYQLDVDHPASWMHVSQVGHTQLTAEKADFSA